MTTDEGDERCGAGECRHPVLCKAQGDNFCLKVYNKERHDDYLKRRQEEKKQSAGGADTRSQDP